jgi:hypothetical protein
MANGEQVTEESLTYTLGHPYSASEQLSPSLTTAFDGKNTKHHLKKH